jgi:hypothetical protein
LLLAETVPKPHGVPRRAFKLCYKVVQSVINRSQARPPDVRMHVNPCTHARTRTHAQAHAHTQAYAHMLACTGGRALARALAYAPSHLRLAQTHTCTAEPHRQPCCGLRRQHTWIAHRFVSPPLDTVRSTAGERRVQNLARSDQRDKTIEQVFTNALKVRIRPQMFVGHHLVRIPRRAAYHVSGGYLMHERPVLPARYSWSRPVG